MQLTDEMRKVISKIDEQEGLVSTHVVVFPNQDKALLEEAWPYDWDCYLVKDYTKAQETTAWLAAERDVTDVLIIPMHKI
jgi:hypothetical protein